jgi:hypothetical protein
VIIMTKMTMVNDEGGGGGGGDDRGERGED